MAIKVTVKTKYVDNSNTESYGLKRVTSTKGFNAGGTVSIRRGVNTSTNKTTTKKKKK